METENVQTNRKNQNQVGRRSAFKTLFYAGGVLSLPLGLAQQQAMAAETATVFLNHDIFAHSVDMISNSGDTVDIQNVLKLDGRVIYGEDGSSMVLDHQKVGVYFALPSEKNSVDYMVLTTQNQHDGSYQLAIFHLNYNQKEAVLKATLHSQDFSFPQNSSVVSFYSVNDGQDLVFCFQNKEEFFLTQYDFARGDLVPFAQLNSNQLPDFNEKTLVSGPYFAVNDTRNPVFVAQTFREYRLTGITLFHLVEEGGQPSLLRLAAAEDGMIMNDNWCVQFRDGNGTERFVSVIHPPHLDKNIFVFLTKDKVLKFCSLRGSDFVVEAEYSLHGNFPEGKAFDFCMKINSSSDFYISVDKVDYVLNLHVDDAAPGAGAAEFAKVPQEEVKYVQGFYRVPAFFSFADEQH